MNKLRLSINEMRLSMEVRLAGIEKESVVDGPGIRLAIFTQGCTRDCPNCHNPKTHDLNGGTIYTVKDILDIYKENPLYKGITFSGGEPFLQPDVLSIIGKFIHQLKGDVVTYTGYYYEELLKLIEDKPGITGVERLLRTTDILIDGPYVDSLRDLELQYRGSSNQRILNLIKGDYKLSEENCMPN